MTHDETKEAIEIIKHTLIGAAQTPDQKKSADLLAVGLDLLCGFLLDVKAIADESRRMSKVATDYEKLRKTMEQ